MVPAADLVLPKARLIKVTTFIHLDTKLLQLLISFSTEINSAVHLQFRQAHEGHKPHAGLDPARASTGVVWTTERAYERGYGDDPHAWANLGQGAPEVDDGIASQNERCIDGS